MSDTRVVPGTVHEIEEFTKNPIPCGGSVQPCNNPAEWLVRAHSHDCWHDGRFLFKCSECLSAYTTNDYKARCLIRPDHPVITVAEVRPYVR